MATSSTCDSACGKEPVDIAKAKGAPLKKILIFGGEVLGSLYAARLKQSGQDVSMLARNKRLKDIKEHGIVLEHALSGKREVVTVPVVEHLHENDAYDLIVVLVRKNQVASVYPYWHHTKPRQIFFSWSTTHLAMPIGLMQSVPNDLCLVSRVPVVRASAMLCVMWWSLAFSSQLHLESSMALPLRA